MEATIAVVAHIGRVEPEGLRVPLGVDVPALAHVGEDLAEALARVAAPGLWRLRVAGSDYVRERRDPTWYDLALHAHDDASRECEETGSMRVTVLVGCRRVGGRATDARELRVETMTYPP